ncbi:MAG: FxsA family protein [Planctomycetota bacterium]
MALLALLFIVVPLAELFLLIRVADEVGLLNTIALCVVTGILGAALARSQGVSALQRVQASLAGGRLPQEELSDGVLILLAGAVLVTPGILTDVAGFALLIPPTRKLIKAGLARLLRNRLKVHGSFPGGGFPPGGPAGPRRGPNPGEPTGAPSGRASDGRPAGTPSSDKVIDVDFVVREDD